MVAIVVDELARHDRQARFRTQGLITAIEQGVKFARIGIRDDLRDVNIHIFLVEGDAGFGRVRNHDLQIFGFAILKEFLVIDKRIDEIIQDIDDLVRPDRFAFLIQALKDQGVKPILLGQIRNPPHFERLHHDHVAFIFPGIIHRLDHPIDERPQEVAFSELHDLDRSGLLFVIRLREHC
jgi:hypothetical protein